ncbi:hypothetical protein Cpir12675_005971, partial [Ceratocystis pirilliformis]
NLNLRKPATNPYSRTDFQLDYLSNPLRIVLSEDGLSRSLFSLLDGTMDTYSASKSKRDSPNSPSRSDLGRRTSDDLRYIKSLRPSPGRDSNRHFDHRDRDLGDRERERGREKERGRERDRSTTSATTVKDRDRDRDQDREKDRDDDTATSDVSNAETIVLPGKDGYSPSKARKVKHEREIDDAAGSSQSPVSVSTPSLKLFKSASSINQPPNSSASVSANALSSINGSGNSGATVSSNTVSTSAPDPPSRGILSGVLAHKKVKRADKQSSFVRNNGSSSSHLTAGNPSSGSPPPLKRRRQSNAPPLTGMINLGGHVASDSEPDQHSKSHGPPKDRDKPTNHSTSITTTDKLLKRKVPKVESDEEGEIKPRRSKLSDPTHSSTQPLRNSKDAGNNRPLKSDTQISKSSSKSPAATPRSVSPHSKPTPAHRRSLSTNGVANTKKKKAPAPTSTLASTPSGPVPGLLSTQLHAYDSDDSSSSGSPRPGKGSTFMSRGINERIDSPAGKGPSKKHLDAHGQTLLARACAKGEYEIAKQRLAERPEDLNVADYAGNTPLQIAALHGSEDIVDLLLQAGCNRHCINYDKETPLLDAVDNGHVGVVRLLLEAGVNPRKPNCRGEEPLARVTPDLENGAEIRSLLEKAKATFRHPSEGLREPDDTTADVTEDASGIDIDHSRSSRAPDSPNATTIFGPSTSSHRRAGTARATKTSNHLLYMNVDDKTLRAACGKGDHETVTHLLQVGAEFNYPEAMTAAARGGHEVVMELLLALGNASPDPLAIKTGSPDTATPILAAIGQENIKVMKLLLDQANFNPTRCYKGMTYAELARERKGVNWKEEEELLKKAYDDYCRKHPEKAKPVDRERAHRHLLVDQDQEASRQPRDREYRDKEKGKQRESAPLSAERERDVAATSKLSVKRATSPTPRDPELVKKKTVVKTTLTKDQDSRDRDRESKEEERESRELKKIGELKEKKRAPSADQSDDLPTAKRSLLSTSSVLKSKKKDKDRDGDSKPNLLSDREMSPAIQKKKVKRSVETDAAASSEGEAAKPRRKLMSKGDLTAEQEKNRRASMASNASSMNLQPSSPRDRDDHTLARPIKTEVPSEKYHDRTKALKRDETPGDLASTGKRHRSSTSPPRRSGADKDESETPNIKRRRLVDGELTKEQRQEQRRKKLEKLEREKAEAGNASGDDDHGPRPIKNGILSRESSMNTKTSKPTKEGRERDSSIIRDPARATLKDALKAKKLAVSAKSSDRPIAKASSAAHESDVEMKDAPSSEGARARKDKESKADDQERKRRLTAAAEPDESKAIKREAIEEKKRQDERRAKAEEKRRIEEEAAAAAEAEAAKKRAVEQKEREREREKEREREREKEREREREREKERRRREKEEAEEQERLAAEAREKKEREEAERKREEAERKREEAEKKRQEEEARIRRERELELERIAEEQRKKAEEEKRLAEEARLKEEKRKRDEERKLKEEEERREKERIRRLEEERRLREEAEAKRKAEEERRKAEEERLQREEEDRLRKEQLEREAAEARRRREEERRAAKEAEQRRIHEEQEQARIAGLPALLRWFEMCPNPRQTAVADKFHQMQGVRWDTLDTSLDGTPEGREQWVLNTQAALLLGEKDLTLSRYTGWQRIAATRIAKTMIWRVENDRYALTSPRYYEIGVQLADYYGHPNDPNFMDHNTLERLRNEAMARFFEMDMFFVKLSDLLFVIPSMPHIRNVRLVVEYRELPETEDQLQVLWSGQKWRKDPDIEKYLGFAPRRKYFVNGEFVKENLPGLSAVSRTPFPDANRVPRRFGLTQVFPYEPDYVKLCKEQGLDHLIHLADAPTNAELPVLNGLASGPLEGTGSAVSEPSSEVAQVNGLP